MEYVNGTMISTLSILALLLSLHPRTCEWLAMDPSPDPLPPTDVACVRLVAAGDLMAHAPVLNSARCEDGTFDFRPLLEGVRSRVSRADLGIVNLETTIGTETGPYTGYPRFTSPPELLDAVADAGFDLVVTANNHCLDGGYDGILRTLRAIHERGLTPCGTYASPQAADSILIIERNGIRFAYLAHTYGTNGLPLPEENPRAVLLLDSTEVLDRLERARSEADAVVLQVHWGDEYATLANESQRTFARIFLESGADLVIGCHPHVVQPVRFFETTSGVRPVAFSLGNFLSAQRDPNTDWGILLEVDFLKDRATGRTWIETVDLRPVWVRHREKGNLVLLEVVDVTSALTSSVDISHPLTPSEREKAEHISDRTRMGSPGVP
jgi:poly-gamma-glutamate synthesis protein (capsule biosynthesis protein)